MRRSCLFALLLLLLPGLCFAGKLVLQPEVIHNGEVAMLRWFGISPSLAVCSFCRQGDLPLS